MNCIGGLGQPYSRVQRGPTPRRRRPAGNYPNRRTASHFTHCWRALLPAQSVAFVARPAMCTSANGLLLFLLFQVAGSLSTGERTREGVWGLGVPLRGSSINYVRRKWPVCEPSPTLSCTGEVGGIAEHKGHEVESSGIFVISASHLRGHP